MAKRNKNTALIIGGTILAVGVIYFILKPKTGTTLAQSYNSPQQVPAYYPSTQSSTGSTINTIATGASALTGLAKAISSLFGGGGGGDDASFAPVGVADTGYSPSPASGYSQLNPNAPALNFLSGIGVLH